MSMEFKKGEPLTASDLNALADAACMNIIGGTGCAVTRLGKRVVISERTGQKLQRGTLYGNVWKLSADRGILRWGFDTGGIAYSVCTSPNGFVYVAGERNNNWSDGGDYASVWKLSPNGRLIWGADVGFDCFEVHATDDAVFVQYLDGFHKVSKLDPSDGSTINTISTVVGSGETRHGFGINATQVWVYGLVSLSQGIVAYDHDLNLLYGATPPATNYVDIQWGLGVSDDLVTLGAAYLYAPPGFTGVTDNTLAVTNTNVSPGPVTQFVVAETMSSSSVPSPFEIHANVDCEENYVASSYNTNDGPRTSITLDQSFVRLYDSGGTLIHDLWITNSGGPAASGGGGRNDVALDESAGLFYVASHDRIGYLENSAIASGSWYPYRSLIAFSMDTGAIVWKWVPRSAGGGDESLTSVFADRRGSVYVTAYSAQLPYMGLAD